MVKKINKEEELEEEFNNYDIREESEPRFNSAISLLDRINMILNRITVLHMYHNNDLQRQKEHILLVKNFYQMISPIISITMIKKYDEEILNMQPETKNYVLNGVQKRSEVFSFEKEKRLITIMIDLQLSIRPYLMPRGDTDDYEL